MIKESLNNGFNCTFGPHILTNSRNLPSIFKTEQSCHYTTIIFVILVITLIIPSKNADMTKEHPCGIANSENHINMS